MTGVLVGVAAVLIGAMWLFDRAAVRRLRLDERRMVGLLEQHRDPEKTSQSQELQPQLDELRDLVENLPRKWEEIRDETRRFQARAYHHVKRVRNSLAENGLEDHEIESLAGELQLDDGEPSEAEGVLALHEDVGSTPDSAETWREQLLAKKFGGVS